MTISCRFKAAVVGCGRMGAFTRESLRRHLPAAYQPLNHVDAILAKPELELVGVCDTSTEVLEAVLSRLPGVPGFTDHRKLIEGAQAEVLTIATRTPDRPGIIRDALSAGVRGLHLEKPLCNSVAQLQELEALLESPTIICTYGAIRRYMPIYQRALELVNAGICGELQQVQICMGRGQLLWAHPHSVDLILYFVGERRVKSVSAHFAPGLDIRGNNIDGDPAVQAALIEFEDGVSGLISQSGGCDTIIACSEGIITIESDGRRLRIRRSMGDDMYWDDVVTELPDVSDGGTRLAMDRMVAGLTNGEQPMNFEDKRAILLGQRILLACGQSHLMGNARVDPDHLFDDLEISGHSNGRYS
jgi:scyllo-inositol 2-dehydrogenase (NAD+)